MNNKSMLIKDKKQMSNKSMLIKDKKLMYNKSMLINHKIHYMKRKILPKIF